MRLTRLREKLELLRGQGVDVVLCLAFNRRLRELSAAEFVRQVLVDGLAVRHLEVGDDFRFGCDRSGDFAFLVNASREQGFTVEAATTVELDGVRVSSTRVRQALAEGDLHLAERLLGRPFSLSGRVLHGQKLGRQLGSPTANIQLKRRKAPLNGSTWSVRWSMVSVARGGEHRHPPFGERRRPSPSGSAPARFRRRSIRPASAGDLPPEAARRAAFCLLEALKAAILADIAAARAYWLGQPLD